MQLSIIIPVFNVKNYIRKCLESVLSITDLSYEVILVQDIYADDSLEDISDLLIIHLYVYVIKRMQAYLLQGMRVYF